MTHDDFKALVHYARNRSEDLMEEKGKKYSSPEDRLSAFKDAAKENGHCPEKELHGYLAKHLVALSKMIRESDNSGYMPTPKELFELTGDISNYMDLLNGLYIERMGLKVKAGFLVDEFNLLV
jgi:hypothetical protein